MQVDCPQALPNWSLCYSGAGDAIAQVIYVAAHEKYADDVYAICHTALVKP